MSNLSHTPGRHDAGASTRLPDEPIPFATDDELAKRIRAVEAEVRRRIPAAAGDELRRADTELADELSAIAHLLDPEWSKA